jgi:prophage antirepressor-like protein
MTTAATVVPFRFESHEVRTISRNGEPWFVAKDICKVLGLENVTKALLKVPENHKGVNPIQSHNVVVDMNIVDEPGLYRLILRSDKPQAEPFMEWVTAEVLPAIRKTGSYAQPETQSKQKSIVALEREYAAAIRAARRSGLKGKQAVIAGDRFTRERTGVSPLDMMGIAPADLPGQEPRKTEKTPSEPLAGQVPEYLNMLETEWRAGRTGIQFTEKEDGQLEAVITMRDLFAEFQDIARRRSVPQYRSTMQLALRCSSERRLLANAGWIFSKTVKNNGIQRWLLVRQNNRSDSKYLSETPAPLLSGEMLGKYESAPAWH